MQIEEELGLRRLIATITAEQDEEAEDGTR
jgi:hypothetical protein